MDGMDALIEAMLERKSADVGDGPPTANCWLALRLENRHILTVFDGRALSATLPIGERYSFVLSLATAYKMQLQAAEEITRAEHSRPPWFLEAQQQLAGNVRVLDWHCPQHPYRVVHPRLYERSAVLIETPIGHIITSANLIKRLTGERPPIGETLQWEGGRLDLWAAL